MAQLRPRVNVNVLSALSLQAAAGPLTVAIMGTAQWGALNEVKTLTSFGQALDVFKDDVSGSGANISLIKGLELLFGNGAGTVLAMRIADGDELKSTLARDGNSGAEVGVLTFSGLHEGTYGDNIGVTITANATTPANRDLEITDGVSLEIFNNGGLGYATNQAVADAINGNGVLVSVAVKAGSEATNVVDAATQAFLASGDNGENSLISSDYTTPFDNTLTNSDFDLMVIPGGDALEALDSFHTTFVGKLNTRASAEDRFAVYLSGIAGDETIATAQARAASGSRLSLVAPSVKSTHRIDGTQQNLNGSYLACAYAGGIAGRAVQSSPTHKVLNVEGLTVDSASGKDFYNNGEQELLLNSRIVPISKIQGSLEAARGVTRDPSTTSVFFEQNIQNITDFLREEVLRTLNPFIGEANKERTRNIMAREADGILARAKLDGVIVAFNPTEVSEGSGPTQVVVTMDVKPTFAINFIDVTLTLSQLSG